MTPNAKQLARKLIMKHESFRERVYTDNTGHLTIGYGHQIRNGTITEHAAQVILDDDLFWHKANRGARNR